MTPLEQALRGLGRRLEDEPVPDVAAAVARRLAGPSPAPAPRPVRRPGLRVAVLALAALLATAATALAASPAVRDRARTWLRAVGIGTSVSRSAGSAPVATLAGAGLGTVVPEREAAARVGLRALAHPFGPPDEVRATRQAVTLVWASRRGLAPAAVPGVGALLSIERRAAGTDPFLVGKVVSATSRVEFVPLPGADGGQAVWIAGAPHAVRTFDGHRFVFRLAADALLWRAGPRVYRLEGRLRRQAALAAARQSLG